jgi:hypothetical protein
MEVPRTRDNPSPLTGHRLGDVIGHTRAADWVADSAAGAPDPPDAGGGDVSRNIAVGGVPQDRVEPVVAVRAPWPHRARPHAPPSAATY